MHDIAAHAGVGVGTAYRRFANKQEIIEALFEQRLDRRRRARQRGARRTRRLARPRDLPRTSPAAATGGPRPDRHHQQPAPRAERADEARDRITPLLDAIVDRAPGSGHAPRADFSPTDIVFLQFALGALMDRTREAQPGPLPPLPHDVPRRHPDRPNDPHPTTRRAAHDRRDADRHATGRRQRNQERADVALRREPNGTGARPGRIADRYE